MNSYVVGIDIGGTKLATVVADKDGNILQKVRKPTESEKGPHHAVQLLLEMVDEVIIWQDCGAKTSQGLV